MYVNSMAKLHQGIEPKEEKKAIAENPEHKVVIKEPEPTAQPVILAIDDGGKRGAIMLKELEARGRKPTTIIKIENKDIVKEVVEAWKSEEKKGNIYNVVYIPVTNTDMNKNKEIINIRNVHNLPASFYFDGHDDQYIANEAFRHKL